MKIGLLRCKCSLAVAVVAITMLGAVTTAVEAASDRISLYQVGRVDDTSKDQVVRVTKLAPSKAKTTDEKPDRPVKF